MYRLPLAVKLDASAISCCKRETCLLERGRRCRWKESA